MTLLYCLTIIPGRNEYVNKWIKTKTGKTHIGISMLNPVTSENLKQNIFEGNFSSLCRKFFQSYKYTLSY